MSTSNFKNQCCSCKVIWKNILRMIFFGSYCFSWLDRSCCLYFSTNFLVSTRFPFLSLCLSLYSGFFSCRIACMSLLCCSIPSVTTNSSLTLPSFSSSTRKICLLKRSRNLPWVSVSLNTQVSTLTCKHTHMFALFYLERFFQRINSYNLPNH